MTNSLWFAQTFLVLAVDILYPRNHLIQGKPEWLVTPLLQNLSSGNITLIPWFVLMFLAPS